MPETVVDSNCRQEQELLTRLLFTERATSKAHFEEQMFSNSYIILIHTSKLRQFFLENLLFRELHKIFQTAVMFNNVEKCTFLQC